MREIAPDDMLYHPTRDQLVSPNRCFLCGTDGGEAGLTAEHVFPKWLQQEFRLWDQPLCLLNGTSLPYRSLTIACCDTCNRIHLAHLERAVSAAVRGGYATFRALDSAVLYQWLLKIFYGILFKESFLLGDRRDAESGSIIPGTVLRQLSMCHSLLQSARFPTEFLGNVAWSIYRFRCYEYEDFRQNFDFSDSIQTLTIAMRMGPVGVIACLQDNNAHEQMSSGHLQQFTHPLHPIQFRELMSRIFYDQTRFNRTPKYITRLPDGDSGGTMQVVPLNPQGLSSKPTYDPPVERDYAEILSQYTGLPLEIVFREPDEIMSWVYNPDGSLKIMGADDPP